MKSIDPHFKKDFDRRLEAWISKQSIWFQLRHASTFSDVVKSLFDLTARLVVILLIAMACMWLFLRHQVGTEGYRGKLEAALIKGTASENGKVVGVSRQKINLIAANLRIAAIELDGGADSIFESGTEQQPGLSAVGVIVSPLGVLDGTYSGWSGNSVTMDSLDVYLKSGAETDEQAQSVYQQLFKKYKKLALREIDVNHATLRWGYTESTQGSIVGSKVAAQYGREGWRIKVTGGKFSYGFIKDADIEEFVAVCDQEGIHVKEAKLQMGDGSIVLSADVSVEANPQITGDISINHLSLEKVLTPYQQKWIGGYISGEGKLGGRAYDGAGPEFDINILLKRKDEVVLEGRFPIFASLEIIDTLNSYQRVKFGAGSFKMKKEGEKLSLQDINLRSGILMYLTGGLEVISKHRNAVMVQQGGEEESLTEGLKSNAEAEKDENPFNDDSSLSLADAIKAGEAIKEESREVQVLPGGLQAYVTGEVQLNLKGAVFDKLAKLKEMFPMDEDKKRFLIDLKVDSFMEEISASVAEKIDAEQKASLGTSEK